jgi:hypothetical protein
MLRRNVWMVLLVLALGGLWLYRTPAAQDAAGTQQGQSSGQGGDHASAAGHEGRSGRTGSAAAGSAAPPSTEPQGPAPKAEVKTEATGPTAAEKLSADEAPVLVMYDAIADAFEKAGKDCDAKGTVLDEQVAKYAPDVSRWAALQSKRSPEERAADQQRLETVAGPRVKRAQDVIRTAMGECGANQRFQDALRNLVALNPG